MHKEYKRGQYSISTNPSKLDLAMIHGFLSESYWAKGISFEKVQKSIENSFCFGLYEDENQVGFARVITDFSRVAYLADVFILEEYRGSGLSKWLMECIMAHPDLQGFSKWLLVTKDAHGLYEKQGFRNVKSPEMYMEMVNSSA